ncbi:MAG TPA: cation:proton antiporter [Verrucomicrobium sp.]|nr:cation:proton antiporter [Verrucomicrobium sp.]
MFLHRTRAGLDKPREAPTKPSPSDTTHTREHLTTKTMESLMTHLFNGPILAIAEGVSPMLIILSILLTSLVLVSLALVRFQQSLLVGYFLCGIAVANSGLLSSAGTGFHHSMEGFAEVGVVLLMFTIGIEFSLAELRHLRHTAFVGGGIQCGLTTLLAFGLFKFCGFSVVQSLVAAVAISVSSTAVSMKTFQSLGIPAGPSSRSTLGIALFQDLLVIFFLVILPALSKSAEGGESHLWSSLAGTVGNGAIFAVAVWLLGRYVVPRVMLAVSNARSRELFTLMVVALCAGVTCLAAALGLSPALGAFVAGLVASGSIYSHRVMTDILPFKDLFLTLFFVSIGLTIDVGILSQHLPSVLAFTTALILVKALIVGLACRALHLSWRASLMTMAALASAGEFSLILMTRSSTMMPWDKVFVQVFNTAGAISMAVVPAMMRAVPAFADWLEKKGYIKAKKAVGEPEDYKQKIKSLRGHAVLCGYGHVGAALHKALAKYGIEVLVIELNVNTVRALKKQGISVLYADAAQRETWELARLHDASLVAFTFPDSRIAFEAIHLVKDINADVPILARSRFASDRSRLMDRGATAVVQDESEAATSMLRHAEGIYHDLLASPAGGEEGAPLDRTHKN